MSTRDTQFQIDMLKAGCNWASNMAKFNSHSDACGVASFMFYFEVVQNDSIENLCRCSFRIVERGASYDRRAQ